MLFLSAKNRFCKSVNSSLCYFPIFSTQERFCEGRDWKKEGVWGIPSPVCVVVKTRKNVYMHIDGRAGEPQTNLGLNLPSESLFRLTAGHPMKDGFRCR